MWDARAVENKVGDCKQTSVVGGKSHREGETVGGILCHLKNESNFPSSPLAPSVFLANLSAPLLSEGFTGFQAEVGEEREKRRETLHSQDKPFAEEKKKKPYQCKLNESVFPPLFKKRGSCSESETKIKSLQRLESSTLACVSFRALERLNQCRRQLESVGDNFCWADLQFLSGQLQTELFIYRKVINRSFF